MADLTPEQIADFVGATQTMRLLTDAINAWSTGSANGGPNGDGYYPIPNSGGGQTLAMSPAKLATLVPTGQPTGLIIPCFADLGVLQKGIKVGWTRTLGAFTLRGVRAWVSVPDQAPSDTYGIDCDVKVNGSSIFSGRRLRILPGNLSSMAAGTPQPQIGTTAFPDDAELSVDVMTEGVQARGLRVAMLGSFA